VVGDSLNHPTDGKFLTKFDEYSIWENWTTYYSIININSGVSFGYTEEVLDINKSNLATNTGTALSSDLSIKDRSITYPATANAKYKSFKYTDTNDISETKYFKLRDECKNPIMLEWDGELGGRDQWLFNIEQAVTESATQGFTYSLQRDDYIENITRSANRIAGDNFQRMTLKVVNLNQNELQSLHFLKRASNVRVWLEKDGTSVVGVIVNTGYDTGFTTGKANYEFTVSIEFPRNFDFFTAKQY